MNPTYIQTLPKQGYCFICPVDPIIDGQPTNEPEIDNKPAGPSALPQDLAEETTRRRNVLWVGVATALLAVALTTLPFFASHNRESAPELRLRQITTNNGENFVVNSVVSPDGRDLLYGDQIGIHLRVIATGESHTIEKSQIMSSQDLWYPTAWYPDQAHFIAVSETLTAQGIIPTSWIVSLLGDGATKLREKVIARSISPNGALIAFTSGGSDTAQEVGIMGRGAKIRALSSGAMK